MSETPTKPGQPGDIPDALERASRLFPEIVEEARQRARSAPSSLRTLADSVREPAPVFRAGDLD